MESEPLINELAGVIRRLERRIREDSRYVGPLEADTQDAAERFTLAGLEDAIVGLLILHIQLRQKR